MRNSLCNKLPGILHKNLSGIGLLLAAACGAGNAMAETIRYPDFQQPFDFTLSLASSDIALQTNSRTQRVSEDRISLSVLTRTNPHLQLGFITGSSYLSLDNDEPTAGLSLNGYHAGLLLRSAFGSNPQIAFHANYLYQESKNETSNQMISLIWQQWAAGVSGTVTLGQRLELSAGWAYHDVDARRRITGAINATQKLALASASQGLFAINWHVRSGGHIGLVLQQGSYQQVEFRFSRKFR